MGFGAAILGQSWKKPVAGRAWQPFDPPPQFGIPDWPTREAPITRTTVPVTIGGNSRLRTLGGTKDMNISKKAQMRDVPVGSLETRSVKKDKDRTNKVSIGVRTRESRNRTIFPYC